MTFVYKFYRIKSHCICLWSLIFEITYRQPLEFFVKKKNVKLSIYSFPCRYRIYFYHWNILYKHRNKYNIPSFVNFFKNVSSSLLLRSLVLAFLTSLKRLFMWNGVICIKLLDLCVQTRLKLGKTYFLYLY